MKTKITTSVLTEVTFTGSMKELGKVYEECSRFGYSPVSLKFESSVEELGKFFVVKALCKEDFSSYINRAENLNKNWGS